MYIKELSAFAEIYEYGTTGIFENKNTFDRQLKNIFLADKTNSTH